MSLYDENKDFRDYVDKYCIKHQITPDEAIEHYLIKAYAVYLAKRAEGKTITTTEIKCGC